MEYGKPKGEEEKGHARGRNDLPGGKRGVARLDGRHKNLLHLIYQKGEALGSRGNGGNGEPRKIYEWIRQRLAFNQNRKREGDETVRI